MKNLWNWWRFDARIREALSLRARARRFFISGGAAIAQIDPAACYNHSAAFSRPLDFDTSYLGSNIKAVLKVSNGVECTDGTLGMMFDNGSGGKFLLSANHVIALLTMASCEAKKVTVSV